MLNIRKIGVLGRTYRHLNRYQQILRVLFKYGFGDLIDTLKIDQYLEIGLQLISRKRREQIERLTRAERMRMALEELGPTFIKLGQIMSTRPDLIPLDFIKEFSKLQDKVPPFPYEEVAETIETEAGKSIEQIFVQFEKEPIAAASIGQVHKAKLKDGEDVVVKVRRPRIRSTIEIDLEIMFHLASLIERHLVEIEVHRPTKIIEEFTNILEREIDYRNEASNMQIFARQFIGESRIYVPKVLRELTTEQMLTMEYIDGVKVTEVDLLKQRGCDLEEIARRCADLVMKQVFVHGFFHADPHPGNLFILPNNVICFLDFGMMARINRQEREDFSDLVMQLALRDEKKMMAALMKLTDYDTEPDKGKLERDLLDFVHQYAYLPVRDMQVGSMLLRLLEILTRHRLRLKSDLFLIIKSISTMESLGRTLDADFDLICHAEPFVREVHMTRFNPKRIAGETLDSVLESLSLLRDIPEEIRAILKLAREGKLRIEFEHRGLEPVLYSHIRASKHIAFAIILASLIISFSLLASVGPEWHEIPVIGLIGFLFAGMIVVWLLISILRRGGM